MLPVAEALRLVVPRQFRTLMYSATTSVLILAVFLSVAALTAFAAEHETSAKVFRAGAAICNITPPLGTLRVGSFAPYPTVHVHDELHARCLVLSDGKTTLALVVCDLLGLHRSVSIEARRLIQNATGITPDRVMISATHTHSAGNALGTSRYTNEQKLDDYQRFLAQRIAEGVRRAKNLLRPAEIAFGKVEAGENISSRRWHLREGKERMDYFGRVNRVWKTSAPGNDYTHPAGPVDPHLYFIALREPNGAPISVYSAYSAHYAGDTGPGHISADYFGMYCEKLKQLLTSPEKNPHFVAMIANATSGDIGLNLEHFRHLKGPKGNYQRSRALADDLASRINSELSRVTWKSRAELDARFREVDIAWRAIEPQLLKWAKNVEARAPRLQEGNLPIAARWSTTKEFIAPLSYAGRVQILAKVTGPAKVPLQVLRIGDVCIGTTPCETYTEVGQAFQRGSPFAQTFMVELNHAYLGYLPTPRHFALGGYSTWPGTNYLEAQASEKIVDHLLDMARELKPGHDRQDKTALPDLALLPPDVMTAFGTKHVKSSRGAQGVPAIERTAEGRLWAAWYAGRSPRGVESTSSYCVLATSGDDGKSWTEKLVIQPHRFVHTYDPCLWIDPQKRMWFFWAQSAGVQDGRMGVWAMVTHDADVGNPHWSNPRRIANGVMLNKPTVLENGDWLLPVGLWRDNTNVPNVKFDPDDLAPYTVEMLIHDLGEERGSNVYRSTDQGKTFDRIGQARIRGTRVDEHMIVERGDGSLWMLLRNTRGIAQGESTDGGRTWSAGSIYLPGRTFANKRFFIRRVQSGALLMVRNNSPEGKRSHMTAFVSDDDGATWKGGLILDERESSYPDGVQAADGTIYIIYDHQRYTLNRDGKEGVGSVQMAMFREEDVRAGQLVSVNARLQVDVTRLRDESEAGN